MKDLKHYFTENAKSCNASNIANGQEVMRVSERNDNANAEECDIKISTNASKKRGRVKIKISKNNTRGNICDIIETNNDLIDKTPSPFAAREIKDDETRDETPKRSKKRKNVKIPKSMETSNLQIPVNSSSENKHSGDENDNLISNENSERNEHTLLANERESIANEAMESSETKVETAREESNAFQVLMTRRKSIQYKPVVPSTPEEEELASRLAEELKNKVKRNKEKLISLADKKGYTKRKLNELEEAEKIEKRLEKRAKVFKQIGQKQTDDKNSLVSSKRISPGSLHNYFSKPSEQADNDTNDVTRIIVEAEVHVPDCRSFSNIDGNCEDKTFTKPSNETTESVTRLDVTRILENPYLSMMNMEKSSQSSVKKPRWSLRINLSCNDGNGEEGSTGEEDSEKNRRGKKDSKPRRGRGKKTNEEKECIDSAESSIKKMKKRSKSLNETSSTILSVEEPRSFDTEEKVSMNICIVPVEKATKKDCEIEVAQEKNQKKTEKLAPLFVKRQKTDPAVLEARRAFLQSIPTKNYDNITIERKTPIPETSILPFPLISHVTQLGNENKIDDAYYERIFPEKKIQTFVPKFDLKELRKVTSLDRKEIEKFDDATALKKSNIDEVLGEIETRCSDAREIWTRISSRSKNEEKKSPKRRGRKKKSMDKKNENLGKEKIGQSCAWTEKYRPTSTRDIVGNEEGAEKFRKWLSGWRANANKDGNSSGEDFYSSDCSYTNNFDNNQVAVLLGPHGSGKTASVYAIAEELGYSVIEVNASSRRAGKIILKELEEATKSHCIKKHDFASVKTFMSENEKALPQNSLILVEDIDLIFEEDEGFISATCQLASNTKRPIVMTGRNACPHLNKMAPQQMKIYYQTAFGSRVSALLELITLAESGYRLPRPCLDRLLQNGDLRKALLQLQYLLISGKPNTCDVPTNFHQSLWQDMRHYIYKPAIKGRKKTSKKKIDCGEKSSARVKEKSIIDNLANDLDKLSFLSTIIEVDDPAIEISSVKLEASLSLDENTHDYSSTRVTSLEIAKWMRDRLMDERITNDCGNNSFQSFRQFTMKKELNVGVNLALSQISSHTLDRRSTTLDYLSTVRAICRAEETRTTKNNKRGNRFFHYLQNLRLPALSTRPSILAAACKILQEKNVDS